MLPLDILYHLAPFSAAIPPSMARVSNPHLSDMVTLYYPWIDLFRTGNGLAPLWNPYSFCGSPLLANAQTGFLYPLNWLFRILPLGPASVIIALAKMWFCGFFAFLFYRKASFQSPAALLGSVCFMLSGHMVVWFGFTGSFPLVSLPYLLWALEVYLGRPQPRKILWLSLGFCLLFIGGQPQTGYVISLAVTFYFAVRSWEREQLRFRLWAGFAFSAVLGMCLAAPQILSFLEYLQTTAAFRLRGTFGWKHYPWFTLLSWIMPRFFGDLRQGNFWGFSSMLGEAVYIGAIPGILALVGVLTSKRDSFFKAALTVLLFGCGGLYLRPAVPVYQAIPFLSGIDNNKLMALVMFGLISMAVIGANALFEKSDDRKKVFVYWCVATLAWIALCAAGFAYFRNALGSLRLWAFEIREVCWLLAVFILGGMVLWLWRIRYLTAPIVVSVFVLVSVADLLHVWIYYYPSYPESYLRPSSGALAYLQSAAPNDRILGLHGMLPPETSLLFRLQDARGCDNVTPYAYYQVLGKIDPNVHDLWSRLQAGRPNPGKWTASTLAYQYLDAYLKSSDPRVIAALKKLDYWSSDIGSLQNPAIISILGVRHVISPRGDMDAARAGFHLVHSSDADVWDNPHSLPRAFVVTRPLLATNSEAALEMISSPGFAYERTAVVTEGSGATTSRQVTDTGTGVLLPATVRKYEAETVEVETPPAENGWLILNDLNYAGWEATVDGKAEPIFAGNFMFRAVKLPPGKGHRVRFVYRPRSFRLGLLLCLSAVLLLLPAAFLPAVRGRRKH